MLTSIRIGTLFILSVCGLSVFGALLRAERIFVVYENSVMSMDPDTGPVGSGMGGGADFDIAISPDQHTMYHFSGEQLALRDAQTLDQFPRPNSTFELSHKLHWILPARSSLALARNGALLYFPKLYSSPTQEDLAIAAFDTVNKRMLPQEAHLSECQGATLMALREDRQLAVVCGGDSAVHFLTIGADGSLTDDFVLIIPPVPVKTIAGPRVGRNDRQESFVQSALSPDGTTLLLAKWDGRIMKVDIASRQVTAWASTPPLANIRIMSSAPCVSPDGSVWYLAARSQTNFGDGNEEILAMDTQTFAVRSTIVPAQPFRAMAISPDGRRLYTTERKTGMLHVLSTGTGEETRVLGNARLANPVHDGPAFLLVIP